MKKFGTIALLAAIGMSSASCKTSEHDESETKTVQSSESMWGVSTLMWTYRFVAPDIQETDTDRSGYKYNVVCIYTSDVANFQKSDDALQQQFKKAKPINAKPTHAMKLTAAALKKDQKVGTQLVDILHGQLMEITRGGVDYHTTNYERQGREEAGNGKISGEVKHVSDVHNRIFSSFIELATENLARTNETCPAQHPRSI